jgi:SAM-dependent methyltransferase
MEDVAARLVDRYDLRNKHIVEIGCGAGYFLKLLAQKGGNVAVGIDPTVEQECVEEAGAGQVRFIRDFYSEQYANLPADFICCLSVFEHIWDPAGFLRMLRRIIGERGTPIYFEVFNALRAFTAGETWSIHYEQCNYFGLESYSSLFRRCGFRVLEADACYEEAQYLYVEAAPDGGDAGETGIEPEAADSLPAVVARFGERHREKMNTWTTRLRERAARGRRVVVWGSGGKGISFLNMLPTQDNIQYVVDINPDRQGRYIPGSAQKIVPPEFLVEYRPDAIILTNVLYEKEIKSQVAELGVTCEFQVA